VYSRLLPKLIPKVSREDVCLLWVSQVRKKIGVMFGDGETTSGGSAPRFYASVIMKVTRIGSVQGKGAEKDEKVANKIKVDVVKNQIAPPFKKVICEIKYGKGFEKEKSLLDLAVKAGVIEKSGNTFSYNGEKIGGSRDKAAAFLEKHLKTYGKILKKVRKIGKW